jgi:hypothetical protein
MNKDKLTSVIKSLDKSRTNSETLIEEIYKLYLEEKPTVFTDLITETDERQRRMLIKELMKDLIDYTLDYSIVEMYHDAY